MIQQPKKACFERPASTTKAAWRRRSVRAKWARAEETIMRSLLAMSQWIIWAALGAQLGGCVLNSTYADALKNWTDKNNEIKSELEALKSERDTLLAEVEALKSMLDTTSGVLDEK